MMKKKTDKQLQRQLQGNYAAHRRILKTHAYRVLLNCGCCSDIVYFKSEEGIAEAFKTQGLTVGAAIVDDLGIETTGIDTFYGWSNADSEYQPKKLVVPAILRLNGCQPE